MINFDEIIDRSNTNSSKYSCEPDVLPMWVADMDFRAPQPILDALQSRLENAILGYTRTPKEWASVQKEWWSRRHAAEFDERDFIFCTGVIPALSTSVRRFTSPGDSVLVQTPVYHVFFNCIKNNGRNVLASELIYENGEYKIDFNDLENKLAQPLTTLFILCNPHNPVGKIWSKDELAKIGELCKKYGVIVISDEIHCDLADPKKHYTPFAAASEICKNLSITCVAPTKTFNIAGIQTASVIVPNELLRQKMAAAINYDEVGEGNAFAALATITAYTKCDEWLEKLRAYIFENKRIVSKFLQNENLGITLVKSEATYLLWLDCSQICENSTNLQRFLLVNAKLWLNDGNIYRPNGSFLRMNIACPKATLLEGLKRLKAGILAFNKTKYYS
ncbi:MULTISPECIES: MalY/PatB family protein [unclassified Campylobacter]|uniref:MalY/PatB family protein n=1 Tax=unclassified Campylobacter TaxID=2593542 RepID=UPI003D33E6CB